MLQSIWGLKHLMTFQLFYTYMSFNSHSPSKRCVTFEPTSQQHLLRQIGESVEYVDYNEVIWCFICIFMKMKFPIISYVRFSQTDIDRVMDGRRKAKEIEYGRSDGDRELNNLYI